MKADNAAWQGRQTPPVITVKPKHAPRVELDDATYFLLKRDQPDHVARIRPVNEAEARAIKLKVGNIPLRKGEVLMAAVRQIARNVIFRKYFVGDASMRWWAYDQDQVIATCDLLMESDPRYRRLVPFLRRIGAREQTTQDATVATPTPPTGAQTQHQHEQHEAHV